jgi:PncC family amidohydrolase
MDVYDLVKKLKERKLILVCAESCTAGLVADSIAAVPGASAVLWGSYVTYTLSAKQKMLGIEKQVLDTSGAVSRETALLMAKNALEKSGADIAVSVTGLAGPDGDGSSKPVGTVWIGSCIKGEDPAAVLHNFNGSRDEIRCAACNSAIEMVFNLLESAL